MTYNFMYFYLLLITCYLREHLRLRSWWDAVLSNQSAYRNAILYINSICMLPPTILGGGIMLFGRPFGCPLTPITRASISFNYWRGFPWNLPQIFIMWVGIAEKILRSQIKGQGHDVAEACISTAWRRGSLVFNHSSSSSCAFLCLLSYIEGIQSLDYNVVMTFRFNNNNNNNTMLSPSDVSCPPRFS